MTGPGASRLGERDNVSVRSPSWGLFPLKQMPNNGSPRAAGGLGGLVLPAFRSRLSRLMQIIPPAQEGTLVQSINYFRILGRLGRLGIVYGRAREKRPSSAPSMQ